MVTIGFTFPAGRYHATPWGHQVNEGLVEWPASPWRLVRALISSGYTRLGWIDRPPKLAEALLTALCSQLPRYSVPLASLAHSRHYMPTGKFASSKQIEATTLVLDTWANVPEEEFQVHWDLELQREPRELLASLVERINYLGRSESWAIGRLLPEDESPQPANVTMHASGTPLDRNEELVSLMAPVTAESYAAWRTGCAPQAELSGKKRPTPKQLKEQAKLQAPYPLDLLEALQWDTRRWQSFGWSQPPGSQLVQYRRPRGTIAAFAVPYANSVALHEPADMILLSIASGSGSAGLLPSITRTLSQAEILHDALVSLSFNLGHIPLEEITGFGDDGKTLVGHQHAHVLPLDLDLDGHIDHFLLWAPMGFSHAGQEVISGVRRTFTKGGQLHLAVAGRALQSGTTTWPRGLERFVTNSRHWASVTPFVAPRFVKKSGTNTLEGQIRAELTSRGLPEPVAVRYDVLPRVAEVNEPLVTLFRHFVRVRKRGGKAPPQDAGWYVEIEFAEAVRGPICIGYGSHFGLGVMGGVRE